MLKHAKYLLPGMLFGILLTKSEAVSWYRMQEMFRFQSFHMFGIIGSAIVVGALSIFLIKKFKVKSLDGQKINIAPKTFNHGNWIGGILFGLGWALTGTCPGPMFVHLGAGIGAAGLMILAAIFGTWVYSALREKLPH